MVLKRVLLAYARWNKAVGYCQGFNVLAALILLVTQGDESDALKVSHDADLAVTRHACLTMMMMMMMMSSAGDDLPD